MRIWILILAGMLVGCPPGSGSGSDDDDSAGDDATGDDDDTADLAVIPDPGTNLNDWGNGVWDEACCSTPEEAYPVGVVNQDAGYIQGVIDSNRQFFYVFRTDPALTEFSFPGWFDEVHLHDGTDLRFGAIVESSSSDANSVTWTVQGDSVYVIEVASDFEGFF